MDPLRQSKSSSERFPDLINHPTTNRSQQFNLTLWFEDVLTDYCNNLIEHQLFPVKSQDSDNEERLRHIDYCVNGAKEKIQLKVVDVDFAELDKEDEDKDIETETESEVSDTDTTQEDLTTIDGENRATDDTFSKRERTLRAIVKYHIGKESTERTEHLLVSIVSRQVIQSHRHFIPALMENEVREIDFYKKVIPTIQEWSAMRNVMGVPYRLPNPTCYYANYDLAQQKQQTWKDLLWNNLSATVIDFFTIKDLVHQGSVPIEGSSMLITQDLEHVRYNINECGHLLSISQIKVAVRQLAKFHAVTWSYEQWLLEQEKKSGSDKQKEHGQNKPEGHSPLVKQWPFLFKPNDLVSLSSDVTRGGILSAIEVIKAKIGEKEAAKYENWFHRLYPKISGIFTELLAQLPQLATIVHLNLNYQNIAFRERKKKNANQKQENENTGSSCLFSDSVPTSSNQGTNFARSPASQQCEVFPTTVVDCKLINWKLATYGSPMLDLTFLLLTSLEPIVREACKTQLIGFYFNVFQETAQTFKRQFRFDLKYFEDEYQRCFISAVLFVLGNFNGLTSLEEGGTEVDTKYLRSFLHAIDELIAIEKSSTNC